MASMRNALSSAVTLDGPPGSRPAPHDGKHCSAFERNGSSPPIVVRHEENMPWVCYV